ncbi:MAG: DUF58 domain-containing protein [Suilimivivens sp.]
MVILFIAFLAGVMYLLQKLLYRQFWEKGVSVRLSFEEEMVEAGDDAALLEVVENRKWLPLATLKVKFQCSKNLKFTDTDNSAVTDLYYRNDLFSIMPYQRITRTHRLNCPQRGYFGIYGIDLVGADLFFSIELHAHQDSNTRIYVLPGHLHSPVLDSAMKKISGEVVVKRYEMEDPFTHRGIREYEPYDEIKSINWKATAKTGELKVNIHEYTAVRSVRIFLNLQDNNILRREELLERSISICARMAQELAEQGIQIAVYANAVDCITGQPLRLEDVAGGEGLNGIYKSLARLDLKRETLDFKETFGEILFLTNALYTVFISPDRHEDFQDLLVSYKEKEDFCWLCPVKTMEVGEIKAELKSSVIMLPEE